LEIIFIVLFKLGYIFNILTSISNPDEDEILRNLLRNSGMMYELGQSVYVEVACEDFSMS
jgi:hypothetical protein